MEFKILVVDDEKNQREILGKFLESRDYRVFLADSGEKALEIIKKQSVDIVITDMKMGGMSGKDLLLEVKKMNPILPVIVITAFGRVEDAVDVMRYGAADYITKPVNLQELLIKLRKELERAVISKENEQLRKEIIDKSISEKIITKNEKMLQILNVAYRAAKTDAPVLILGESGTGKELLAKTIHELSERRNHPFVPVNCAALNLGVLESELFGHEKGAFTGAVSTKKGRFELAENGTLFLDEIGDVPLEVQVKLLRVLQEREIERVGGTKKIPVNFRLICATNRNLQKEIEENKFREDLFYRINVITLELPPLRERKEDLPLLIDYFLNKWSNHYGIDVKGFTRDAYTKLLSYHYPGNIRELGNIIQRAVVLARGEYIDFVDLAGDQVNLESKTNSDITFEPGDISLPEAVEKVERKMIIKALEKANNVQTKAAELLGISERNLRYKMMKYNLKK
ncbi:two-component system, NtrC family, response regulator [Thermotomaculum hydrothermale]|uniref:Two-component system, NtrC family, response regulator n=1 Tax=Thermotomaculum hydrothermale TaxID=981385 RepID=A0A7R6PY98_9BACT|nr:sigma-54 dependent transcriptional regulator [Thermotomaculum hydrothermale]BBB33050.1 two-component system, NtrC family, response regulator [Thermotomaculum hydrothermale]